MNVWLPPSVTFFNVGGFIHELRKKSPLQLTLFWQSGWDPKSGQGVSVQFGLPGLEVNLQITWSPATPLYDVVAVMTSVLLPQYHCFPEGRADSSEGHVSQGR
jgi:hypothetical protein